MELGFKISSKLSNVVEIEHSKAFFCLKLDADSDSKFDIET